jgi:5-dehydro-2-deoxygluconokinase
MLGYTKSLFILAFDHRSSFLKKMLGTTGEPSEEISAQVADYKKVIYEGFKQAVQAGVPKESAAVLADEQFGAEILKEAHQAGYLTCLSTEKSGLDEFDFEYGGEFGKHLEDFQPTFAKCLIRYNPEGDQALNARQRGRLKVLSDYCHTHGFKFLIEPLIPATPAQLESAGGNKQQYDLEVRPKLMFKMIEELQEQGIEPDVWKIEGLESPEHYKNLVAQARRGGRENVSCIVLGRGEEKTQVEAWLSAAKNIPGIIGFAIGRTIFWEPLMAFKEGRASREQTSEAIGKNYLHFYQVFTPLDNKWPAKLDKV